MDTWFNFILKTNSSEQDALKDLSSCALQNSSLIEDLETGKRVICASADKTLFPNSWTHVAYYEDLSAEIDWNREWISFSPYYENGIARVPLTDFSCSSQENVLLHPGPGFGDLSHPTTTLSLELLSKYAENQVIIDLGCGSGILGLAALCWGATFIYSIDIDKAALIHSEKNAILNEKEPQMRFETSALRCLDPVPSLLVMNMIFEDQKQAILSLSSFPDLWITSGILKEHEEPYLAWATKEGLCCLSVSEKDGWLGFVFSKIDKTT